MSPQSSSRKKRARDFSSCLIAASPPKGTPKDIIAKLNKAVVESLGDSNVLARLADLGQHIPPREQQTPEALRAYQEAEIKKWWPIVKSAGIKAE
jgi:tripartite-type tricarboxylate transporter receptor subunit TctC